MPCHYSVDTTLGTMMTALEALQCIHEHAINEQHISEKNAALGIMQSHPG